MNSLGAMAAAFFFGYLTEIFSNEPYLSGIKTIAVSKTSYAFIKRKKKNKKIKFN
jgi:hypothetical protein